MWLCYDHVKSDNCERGLSFDQFLGHQRRQITFAGGPRLAGNYGHDAREPEAHGCAAK